MSGNNRAPHSLFTTNSEIVQHYRLFIDDLIQEGAMLHDILNALHDAGSSDTLETRINSGGGYVKYGQQLINVMKDKFKGRSMTILEAEASSMAALIFMSGDYRVVYPHSILMVHEISMYLQGKASESQAHMSTYLRTIKNYFITIFGDSMSKNEIKRMFNGADFWFDAKEMCVRGMATHVVVNGETITSEEYLKYLKDPSSLNLEEEDKSE